MIQIAHLPLAITIGKRHVKPDTERTPPTPPRADTRALRRVWLGRSPDAPRTHARGEVAHHPQPGCRRSRAPPPGIRSGPQRLGRRDDVDHRRRGGRVVGGRAIRVVTPAHQRLRTSSQRTHRVRATLPHRTRIIAQNTLAANVSNRRSNTTQHRWPAACPTNPPYRQPRKPSRHDDPRRPGGPPNRCRIDLTHQPSTTPSACCATTHSSSSTLMSLTAHRSRPAARDR